MTVNLSKALSTLSSTILVVAASATSSYARPHAQRLSPTQNQPVYYHPDSNSMRDSSCFSGLPALYACSANGG
jgi:hypothetical protein